MTEARTNEENAGWTEGWAVFLRSIWDLQGLYKSRFEADLHRAILGVDFGYEVAFARKYIPTKDFTLIDIEDDDRAAMPAIPMRWEKADHFIQIEGTGHNIITETNVSWTLLPLELKEQVPLHNLSSCMLFHKAMASWAKENGFTPVGEA